jgi:translation initiation factor IF-2
LLDPEEKEVTVGWVDVRQVFRVPKAGSVAGSYVTEGKVTRAAKARLIRNGAIVHEGSLASLKRFKDDVREVEKGYECGIALEGYQDVKPGDRIEFFVVEKQARRLGS